MTFKIRTKLILITAVILLSAFIAFYYLFERAHHSRLRAVIVNSIQQAEHHMHDIERSETEKMSAAIAILLTDRELKDAFSSGDRDRLYEYGYPIFKELKEKSGITHFYFHLPNGINFLRLHEKELHGDRLERITFKKAQETGKIISGIELGKTAFALRVVSPYYSRKGDLIGYIELAQEVEHFLDELKRDTNNSFAIIAEKKYLNRQDWGSVRAMEGLHDNWDELKDHLWISRYLDLPATKECFVERNIELFKDASLAANFSGIKEGVACGGFPIRDASGRTVGVILSLIDVSEQKNMADKTRINIISISLSLFLLTYCIIAFFAMHSISRPIEALSGAAAEIAAGGLKRRVDISSRDEIGYLGRAMNEMAERLDSFTSNLQVMVEQRTKELKESEERYRLLAEASQDAIFVIDRNDKVKYINGIAADSLGIRTEDVIGKPRKTLFPPEISERQWTNLQKVFETGTVCRFEGKVEYQGRLVWLDTFLTPLVDNTGEVGSVLGVSRDITERKKAEEKIKEQMDYLKRWETATVGRELRMMEIVRENEKFKKRIEDLEGQSRELGHTS